MPKRQFLFLCEHASHSLPKWARPFFPKEAKRILESHRGWDEGAPSLAKFLARGLKGSLHCGMHSRLLLDLNRSVHSKNLWSYWSKKMPESLKQKALLKFYVHYREHASRDLARLVSRGPVGIFAVHSFVPVLNGKTRSTDVGLLFHHASDKERLLAESLRFHLRRQLPDWKIHFNLPYRGFTDCFLNDLSEQYQANLDVVGLFLEFNQRRISTLSERRKLSEMMKKAILLASGVN
ncbi:MAG: N-formylglutamate amidohydrolase [Bdellovibrionales bacterium]|nr:N-formylglutamate amidohydrolase [Bdellovibrionales bacterium]